jgi:hypothetical protein
MKKRLVFVAGLTIFLTGCIVAPPRVVVPVGVAVPAGVVYVSPSYPVPAPGYVWAHHPRYGWGYRHHHHGWHRGWR